MTRVDLHPDELFDRLRAGWATATERARLHAHLKSCSACRLEQALLDDADEAAAAPDAAEVAERARRRALTQLLAQRGVAKNGRFRLRRRSVLFLAAALTAACFAAVAVGRTRARIFGLSAAQSSAHVAAIGKSPTAPPSAPSPSNTAASAPSAAPSDSPDPNANKPTGAAARSTETSSASELFAHANQARHQGNAREAATLYRSLERSFPKSAEANVARVAFGRLLLDRLSDPRAALGEFDAYLASGGALREEALVGRALSLGRLGRNQEEKASWAALLTAFPRSTYAERAKERISELD